MTDLAKIYEPWGGNAEAMASEIGVLGVTARQWRQRGFIPPVYWDAIIEAAAKRGQPVSVSDFPKDANLEAFSRLLERAA